MRVRLMSPEAAFDPEADLPHHISDLTADLGLDALLNTMAGGDRFLREMAHAGLFQSVTDPEVIRYRQEVLADCSAQPDVIARLYAMAGEALEVERHAWIGWNATAPSRRLAHSHQLMVGFVDVLRRLRTEILTHAGDFSSPGMRALSDAVRDELGDDYLGTVDDYLMRVQFRGGTVETSRLGTANVGAGYVLRTPERAKPRLRDLFVLDWGSRHTVTVADRDMAGMEQLAEMRERGIARAAEALGQSAEHVKAFFLGLRRELGFYLACLNLQQGLVEAGQPMCVPSPSPVTEPLLHAEGLYEPMLVLRGERQPVGSDVTADGAWLVVITGANQGGKSTFLRSLGCAQLMMQCGMFVAARSFASACTTAVHTHFKREEDESMAMGKFDEELSRMSLLVDRIRPGALVLCNESFSSTNEREAALVGGDVVLGLLHSGVRVHLVTHMYALAQRLSDEAPGSWFGRADRLEDGRRTFEIVPGAPLRTSFAEDLYADVFGHPLGAAPASA